MGLDNKDYLEDQAWPLVSDDELVWLTILFLFLKVTKVIDWSSWWIFSPLWIPLVLAAVFFSVAFFLISKE